MSIEDVIIDAALESYTFKKIMAAMEWVPNIHLSKNANGSDLSFPIQRSSIGTSTECWIRSTYAVVPPNFANERRFYVLPIYLSEGITRCLIGIFVILVQYRRSCSINSLRQSENQDVWLPTTQLLFFRRSASERYLQLYLTETETVRFFSGLFFETPEDSGTELHPAFLQ